MTQISIEGGIYFDTSDLEYLGWSPYLFLRGPVSPDTVSGYLPVMPYTLTVDIPDDFDPRAGQIDALQAQKREAMAKFQAMVTEIDRRIAKLQAIEHSEAA